MTREEIKSNLRTFFMEICPIDDEFDDDIDLLNDWFIDSFAIVQTVMFIEEKFDLAMAHDDINEDNFLSTNTLANFIEGKLSD